MTSKDKGSQITTKKSSRHYRVRRSESSDSTRSASLSIRLKEESFSNIDSHTNNSQIKPTDTVNTPPTDRATLKAVFLNNRTPLEYSREHPKKKLLIAQYLLQTMQTDSIKSVPFVIRFNEEDMKLELEALKRKIRDTFKKTLGVVPHYWLSFEYSNKGVRGKHCNGEILVDTRLLPDLKNALERLYGLETPGLKNAVKFPVGSREKQSKKHGSFYAVYNWTGYGSKELTRIEFERDFMKNPEISKGKHYTISKQLNSMAKALHAELIKTT